MKTQFKVIMYSTQTFYTTLNIEAESEQDARDIANEQLFNGEVEFNFSEESDVEDSGINEVHEHEANL